MGKLEDDTSAAVLGPPPAGTRSYFNKSTCRWIVSVVLSVHLLVFAVLSIHFHFSRGTHSPPTSVAPSKAQVEASFRLRRPISLVNASLPQLQLDLQDEIGLPNTEVDIISIFPLSVNWTEVSFAVTPDPSNDSIMPADLSLLKETFVELFMERSVNLSLSSDLFGRVSHFEVVQFPGGVTVVPPQPGFPLSKVLVLFNFTLHNSLSHIASNFAEFRQQLANGIILKANESLFVQLTNLEGSTLKSPVVVQTSILPVVGLLLPPPRLKQLAQEIIASPRRNLGLNHTLFGRVKGIELSSYLRYSLKPPQAPSPSPCLSPYFAPQYPPHSGRASAPQRFRRHRQHPPAAAPSKFPPFDNAQAPSSEGIVAAPYRHHAHHHHRSAQGLAPSPMPTVLTPTNSGSLPPSPSSSPEATSSHREPSKPPSPSFRAPVAPSPGSGSAPQISGTTASPLVVSLTSSALTMCSPSLAMVAWLVIMVLIW